MSELYLTSNYLVHWQDILHKSLARIAMTFEKCFGLSLHRWIHLASYTLVLTPPGGMFLLL